MAWQDNYLQAQFRNAKFFISSADYTTGRRTAEHIYPRANLTDYEDLGQAPKKFSLDAYVLGDDYFEQREALETALDTGGPGILVHPYRGVFNVVARRYAEKEHTAQGRMARFKIDFAVYSIESLTTVSDSTIPQVLAAKQEVLEAARDQFEDNYSLDRQPNVAIVDARTTLEKAFATLESSKRIVANVAEFKRDLAQSQGNIIGLSLSATALFTSLERSLNFGTDMSSTPGASTVTTSNAKDQKREQSEIYSSTETTVVNTPDALATAFDYPAQQVQNAMAHQAVAALIGVLPFVDYRSVQEVREAQDFIFDLMDETMSDPNISDGLYAALRDSKKALYRDLEIRLINLPLLVEIELPEETNALALAYRLYGGIGEADNLVAQNALMHPGFVPAAVSLQIRATNE